MNCTSTSILGFFLTSANTGNGPEQGFQSTLESWKTLPIMCLMNNEITRGVSQTYLTIREDSFNGLFFLDVGLILSWLQAFSVTGSALQVCPSLGSFHIPNSDILD